MKFEAASLGAGQIYGRSAVFRDIRHTKVCRGLKMAVEKSKKIKKRSNGFQPLFFI